MSDNFKGFYDKTADIYDLRQQNKWTARLREVESDLMRAHASGRVLDVGCGTGYHTVQLAKDSKTLSLVGLDISKVMLETARKSAASAEFVEGSAEQLPFNDDSFDTVLCMFSTLNLCDHRKALAEMHRVLRPNGRAVISVSSVWDNDGKSEKRIRIEGSLLKLHLFDADELRSVFDDVGFSIMKFDSLFRSKRPRWGDWNVLVEDDLAQPVERGAMYLYVLQRK